MNRRDNVFDVVGRSWGALVEPVDAVALGHDRRDARLLATVLVALVPLGTASALAQLVFVPGFFPSFCVIAVAMGALLAAYALSRTVHFRLGAAITVVVCILACFATLESNPSDASAPAFMFIPVLVATTFLPLRAAAFVAAVASLGLFMLGACVRAIDVRVVWAGGAFLVIASSLSLLLARHRALVERDRHAALAESEARYRALFHAAFEGLVTLRDGVIVDANEASARIFGSRGEALTGTAFEAPFDPESRATVRAVVAAGDGRAAELTGHKPDGDPFVVELVAQRSLHGDASAVAVGIRDMRERKEVEARLRLVDRLSALGTLTAGVAHEISNPLTYSLVTADVLEDELRPWLTAEASASLADLREGLGRIEAIVRTLKTLSRPDEDSFVLVDVVETVESSIRIADLQLRGRTRLVRDFHPVPAVPGNPAKLGQVVLNLLLNAVQAMPDVPAANNEITVRVALAEDEVEISVKDSGLGIAPEVIGRIFDPFFTTKPVGLGTGLGLSICHGIVTSLGGRIAVDSKLGVGSTFRVLLPRGSNARRAPALLEPESAPRSP